MKARHLNCVSMCPPGGRFVDGEHGVLRKGTLVCHCLLLETDRGLVLVDTGFGIEDVHRPRERLSHAMLRLMAPDLDEAKTARRQIEALGHRAEDVRHIVLTHLDFDHAGGLDDFPEAEVHLLESEREVAFAQRSPLDRQRFRPSQWSTAKHWRTYPERRGEPWCGFDCVRNLDGLPPEILLVPLHGHTLGHAGVAVDLGGRWLLHAGDAYFYHGEMDPSGYHCTPGLRLYQTMMEQDRSARLHNQRRLRSLAKRRATDVRVFCAHDALELDALARATEPLAPERPQPSPSA